MTKTSFKVLRMDPEIMWLPVLAGLLMIAAVVGLGFGAFGLMMFGPDIELLGYVVLFAIYVVTYGIAIYFNAAVVEMASIRFKGGDPTLKDGLRKSRERLPRIMQWALVAATVGVLLRILRDQARDNPIARMLIGFLEFGWNVATFFVVPVLVHQDKGPMDAVRSSTSLMKRTWGESLTGVVTTGLVFFALGLLGLVPLAIGFFSGSGAVLLAMIALAVFYWIGLAAANSAIDGILVAALYAYAEDGQLPQVFRDEGVDAASLAY